MGLSGENQMDRPGWMVQDFVQTLHIGQDQIRPLIRGKTPGKADHQGGGIYFGIDLFPPGFGIAVPGPVLGDVIPDIIDHSLLEFIAGAPQHGVGDIPDLFPGLGIGNGVLPFAPQIEIKKVLHLRSDKGSHVHPIGHRPDGDIQFVKALPDIAPHAARHLPMDLADPVAKLTHLETQNGHEERLVVAGFLQPQVIELRPGDPRPFDEICEIMFDEILGESLVSRLYRRMGGKNATTPHHFTGLIKIQPFLGHQELNQAENEKGRMPFIEVIETGFDAQFAKQTNASRPQEQFLFYPRSLVRRIETSRYFSVLGGVAGNIGIQEINRQTADLHLPDIRIEGPPRKLEGNLHLVPLLILDNLQGHIGEVTFRIFRDLDPVLINELFEIPVPVQEPDPHQGDIEIAGRLDVVSGKDAQSARIDRQALMEAIFRGKIGDRGRPLDLRRTCQPPAKRLIRHVAVKLLHDGLIEAQINGIVLCFKEPLCRDCFQHANGIVAHFRPELGVQGVEQLKGAGIPCPP
ncbi:MAG: hypothetical protein A4E72_01518 [Syntrophus sp. PtaU1.Bin208]|nr:MAG: hypothetical protein A4E72_01518 [Syntrophus sp. PtaU1.Bin208]